MLAAYRNMTVAALALMAAQPQPAQAQTACGSFETLKAQLAKDYHEEPIGGGIVNDKTIVQVFASAGGATWTVLSVQSSGLACIAGAGKDREPGKLPVAGKGT